MSDLREAKTLEAAERAVWMTDNRILDIEYEGDLPRDIALNVLKAVREQVDAELWVVIEALGLDRKASDVRQRIEALPVLHLTEGRLLDADAVLEALEGGDE